MVQAISSRPAYRAQQNVERGAHIAHQKLLHGLNREAHLGIRGAWVPALEALAGQVEGGFGRVQRDTRLQACGGLEEVPLISTVRVGLEWEIDIRERVEGETRGQHADDGVGFTAEGKVFAHDGWVRTEPALPEAIG